MKNFLLCACCFSVILVCASCSNEVETSVAENNVNTKHAMLYFANREVLAKAIDAGQRVDTRGVSLQETAGDVITKNVRSAQNVTTIDYSELVPEQELRNLLNPEGEIQVGDTIYRINEKGTFYAHKKHYASLLVVSQHLSPDSVRINENLLRFGDVFLIKTFKGHVFEPSNIEDSAEDEEQTFLETRAGNSLPEIRFDTFARVPARRKTALGKFLQSFIVDNTWTKEFPANHRRRLACTAFDYNYGFRQSIGIQAKVQKKVWIWSWAKMQNWPEGQLRAGYRNVVVRFDCPEKIYGALYNILGKIPEGGEYQLRDIPGDVPILAGIRLRAGRVHYYAARSKRFSYSEVLSNVSGAQATCIYGADGIYVYFPIYEELNYNRKDPSEVMLRLSYGGYGVAAGTAGFFTDNSFVATGEFLGGDFFACCYSQDGNEWIGRILYW